MFKKQLMDRSLRQCSSKLFQIASFIGTILCVPGLLLADQANQTSKISPDVVATAKANSQFAWDLYQRLAETQSGRSLFFSPFSVSMALSIAAEGAVNQTYDQMAAVLHVPQGQLARFHQGQHGLLVSAVPNVSPEDTKKIAVLRDQLAGLNAKTEELMGSGKSNEAQASGAAAKKIADELNALLKRTAAYELSIANALWVEQTFQIPASFGRAVNPNYGISSFPSYFKEQPEFSREQINQWVLEHTNNRIRDLLPPMSIDERTRLVITNAVFFKGVWADPFDATWTQPEPFYTSNGQSTNHPMMHQVNRESARYGAFLADGNRFATPTEIPAELQDDDPSLYPHPTGHTMLSLDYQGGKIQMVLLVPQTANGLSALERLVTVEKLAGWISQMEQRPVDITFPKLQLEQTYSLAKTLQDMGMKRCFEDPGQNQAGGAQFEKLSQSRNREDQLYISQVLHKSFLNVNEEGTEAAAATAVVFPAATAAPVQIKKRPFVPIFKADKPFIFLIRDRDTNSILFLGRFTAPDLEA